MNIETKCSGMVVTNHISGTAKASVIIVCTQVGYANSCNIWMINHL